jgi:excisionase family DNA binding protein
MFGGNINDIYSLTMNTILCYDVKGGTYMNNKLINIKELSEYFGVAVPTLYQWAQTEKIPSIKCGRLVRFELDAVLEYLKSGSEKKGGRKL